MMAHGSFALAVLLAAPAMAHADALADPPAQLPPIAFALPKPADHDEDRARWSIPDELDALEPREAPRLRFNGRKVKLRVPIG